MNKPSIKDFAKELTLTDMQGKDISKIQDIDYEAYSLALEKYITILDKALENVINDCDEVGVDWFDSIAVVDESKPLLDDCIDKYDWLEGIKQYYLKKASGDKDGN